MPEGAVDAPADGTREAIDAPADGMRQPGDAPGDAPADAPGDAPADVVDAGVAEAAPVDAPDDAVLCDPTHEPKDDPCVVSDAYAVFVDSTAGSPSDAGGTGATDAGVGDGSMLHPFSTIAQALGQLHGKKRVYVCDGVYREQVDVAAAVSLFGGFSCGKGDGGASWAYAGGIAQVIAPAVGYALTVTGPASDAGTGGGTDGSATSAAALDVTIEDMGFSTPAAATAGTSSIAAFVRSANVHLVRVALGAGQGADGLPGADGVANPNFSGAIAPAGAPQLPGSGGAGGTHVCTRFGASTGGRGGAGRALPGTPGTATPPAFSSLSGRDGYPSGVTLPDGGVASANDPGADGEPGSGGLAATAQAYGTLSATGWAPSGGGDGSIGNPGQGGAGATDLTPPANCPGQVTAGGGGGGAGGCGGAPGTGGGGGGASIALAVLGAYVDLRGVALTTAAAGKGGDGGGGQDGQAGGAGGDDPTNPNPRTPGAPGGNGAGGAGGAGGIGGISVGVLYKDSTVVLLDASILANARTGSAGLGGAAGAAGRFTAGVLSTGSDGAAGAPGLAGASAVLLQLR